MKAAFEPPKMAKAHAKLAGGRIIGGGNLNHSSLLAPLHNCRQLNHSIEFLVFFVTRVGQKEGCTDIVLRQPAISAND